MQYQENLRNYYIPTPQDISHINRRLQNNGDYVNYSARANGEVDASLVNVGASGTSAEIDSRGMTSVRLYITVTGTATFDITLQGSDVSGGTYLPIYDNTATPVVVKRTVSQSMITYLDFAANWNQVVVTRTSGTGTVTIKAQPCIH